LISFISEHDAIKIDDKAEYIFLSGPWDLVRPAWEGALKYKVVAALESGSTPGESPGSWFSLRHTEFDGITDGSWWFGAPCNLAKISPVASVCRLKHILSPLERGRKFVPKPDLTEDHGEVVLVRGHCHPGGLLPTDKPQASVISPSVYGGWVTRRLTFKEVLEAWDHSPSGELSDRELWERFSVWKSPPNKILRAVGESILNLRGNRLATRLKAECVIKEDPVEATSNSSILPIMQDDRWDFPLQLEIQEARAKAAKDDDAAVPTQYWDVPFWNHFMCLQRSENFIRKSSRHTIGKNRPLLDVLREFILIVRQRTVYRSFSKFMKKKHGALWYRKKDPDLIAGRDCLDRGAKASFWEWCGGSRLFFWRWPDESRIWARDGHHVYVRGRLPSYRKSQPRETDPGIKAQVTQKLRKFIDRVYIRPGAVKSLISFFSVPKGEGDVRLVFDSMRSGLNDIFKGT
jgi:hypothetical protein